MIGAPSLHGLSRSMSYVTSLVLGAGIHAYAEDVNPVKEGNVISGHVVEKGTETAFRMLPY
jgi:hypothetical protein